MRAWRPEIESIEDESNERNADRMISMNAYLDTGTCRSSIDGHWMPRYFEVHVLVEARDRYMKSFTHGPILHCTCACTVSNVHVHVWMSPVQIKPRK